MRKKKCYIYTRVSTIAQTEGYSLEAQQEKLKRYAEYKNLQIAGEYCDAGKSGKSIKGRPAFQQMMDDIIHQKDGVSYVLVFKLSRFGRNAADVMKSLQLLLDYEVDLVSIDDAIDSSTQGGRLTLAILSAVAEIERENIVVQFNAGRMQKFKEGEWVGGPIPYGYRKSEDGLVKHPIEAEIVKRIYDMYLQEDMGMTTIVGVLNEEGLTRVSKGIVKKFNYNFVKTILDNPFYCGRIFYNRRTNSNEIGRQEKQVIESLGKHEPTVSIEQWEQVQKKRKETSLPFGKVEDPERISLLSGIVKCPMCGKGMISIKNKKQNKNRGGYYKTLYNYACGYSRKQKGKTCSFRHTYNQEKVDAAVLEIIERLAFSPAFEKHLAMYRGGDKIYEELESQLKNYRKKLYHQEHEKNRLGEVLDNLDIFADDYLESYDKIQAEIEGIYDEIDSLELLIANISTKLENVKNRSDAIWQVKDMVKNLPALLKEMSCEEKRKTYRTFIEKIEVFPEETTEGRIIKSISFKFPVFYGNWEPHTEMRADESIYYTLNYTEMEISSAEAKATYPELKRYILEKHGLKVSSLYIAQIKRKYGIEVGDNRNKSKNEGTRVPQCPKAKEIVIVDALKHFRMLSADVEMAV